jgi:hypothetical protein
MTTVQQQLTSHQYIAAYDGVHISLEVLLRSVLFHQQLALEP